jgi:hypothetical protein
MSKQKTNQDAPRQASRDLPALPPKRARRRSVRASHSWCWRRPPSRRRVETTQGRFLPERALAPAIMPVHELQS